jgi:hypothetical protein
MKSIKKIWVFLVYFSVCASAAPAFLIQGGINLSSTTNKDTVSSKKSMRQGFNVAIGLEQTLNDNFSIVSGFSIETRGEKKTSNSITQLPDLSYLVKNVESDVNFLYLQIPVFAQYNILLGPGKINIFAGPELGFLLNAKTESVSTSTSSIGGFTSNDTADVAKKMNMLDGGISAGFGYELSLWQGALFLRPSYYYGLTNYYNDQKGIHNNIKVAIGYKFNIKK